MFQKPVWKGEVSGECAVLLIAGLCISALSLFHVKLVPSPMPPLTPLHMGRGNSLVSRPLMASLIMKHSFVYTSGHCRRWRSRMEVKIMAGSLFVHCKIAYFYSVTADKWLIVSLPNFVTIRRTHFSVSCKIFSWIRLTELKIHAVEFCDFIKDSVSPSGLFVPCSLTVTSTWRPRLTAHCPIGERH